MSQEAKQKFFKDGKLILIPKKQAAKLGIMEELIKLFETDKVYTEKEVNEVLKVVYSDYAVLRRYLVDYKFLERDNAGNTYNVNKAALVVE